MSAHTYLSYGCKTYQTISLNNPQSLLLQVLPKHSPIHPSMHITIPHNPPPRTISSHPRHKWNSIPLEHREPVSNLRRKWHPADISILRATEPSSLTPLAETRLELALLELIPIGRGEVVLPEHVARDFEHVVIEVAETLVEQRKGQGYEVLITPHPRPAPRQARHNRRTHPIKNSHS